ncbi:HNH endonuclease [Akkermansiaceae bacterium]|nr:HNH endonuclease [Akkermansiaceae bacterium]
MSNNWTREEHILAFNLYNRIPFGKTHRNNREVIKLAHIIGRTPSSVGMKLGNFARLDPALQARGITGLKNGAKGEKDIWDEFKSNPEDLAYESERLLAERINLDVVKSAGIDTDDLPAQGKEREAMVKQRVNQSFFRRRVLSAYEHQCCITGLAIPQLLVAGHIIPWAQDTENRLNPHNGLCLNMIHDKAFDRGLMWIDEKFIIHYEDEFREHTKTSSNAYEWLIQYEGKKLQLPPNFTPSTSLLKQHKLGAWR